MNLGAAFLTGLTTGGLSCLAMQGGLLASVVANQKGEEAIGGKLRNAFDVQDVLPVGIFLGTKLAVHTLFGFLLGSIGSALELSLGLKLAFQLLTAAFLFATAMNLLEVHPVFRFVAFQPPKFLQRLIRGSSRSRSLFAPAVLGLFTIFIPCGVTQAMELVAISSGSPWLGAGIMFAFVLGTMPLFSIIGVATSRLSEVWNHRFLQAAALAILLLALSGVNGVLTVVDAPVTAGKVAQAITSFGAPPQWYGDGGSGSSAAAPVAKGVQTVKIEVTSNGYSPRYVKVKKGVPVQLELVSYDAFSCASSFILRKFGIQVQLQPTDRKILTFTPQEKGRFPYTCSMGMYSGILEVI
jgi:sulfite exporter TauE/SafE